MKVSVLDRELIHKINPRRVPSSAIFTGITIIIALLMSSAFGLLGPYAWITILGIFFMAGVLLVQQYELAITIVIAVRLYADWYWGFGEVALVMTIVLLGVLFLVLSPKNLWLGVNTPIVWILLVIFSMLPMLQGITLPDGLYYYANVIVSALLFFWLGRVAAHDRRHFRRLIQMVAFFGTLVALHAIILFVTGNFLLASNRYDAYLLLDVRNFPLYGSNRVGSFLVNPDTAGTFFAFLLFLPLGLFFTSSSWIGKLLSLVEVFLMLLALLFTYSSGGWVSAFVGLFIFILLTGKLQYSIQMLLLLGVVTLAIIVLFPSQVNIQLQHAGAPNELSLRVAAWQTGIEVIKAFPLTGIGLGRYDYIVRANPYRSSGQYLPLYHPHNSYLEVAALGGLPIAILLYTLLLIAIFNAVRTWVNSNVSQRALLGGVLASIFALSVNSMSSPCWTLPPLLAIGWLLLGSMSSPHLQRDSMLLYKKSKEVEEKI